jgi:hypothetical protein
MRKKTDIRALFVKNTNETCDVTRLPPSVDICRLVDFASDLLAPVNGFVEVVEVIVVVVAAVDVAVDEVVVTVVAVADDVAVVVVVDVEVFVDAVVVVVAAVDVVVVVVDDDVVEFAAASPANETSFDDAARAAAAVDARDVGAAIGLHEPLCKFASTRLSIIINHHHIIDAKSNHENRETNESERTRMLGTV